MSRSKRDQLPKEVSENGFAALVVSDIHAIDSDPTLPESISYVSSAHLLGGSGKDPLRELKSLAPTLGKINCIICPGDLSDKANPSGLNYAWKELNDLADKMGNVPLITTPGNHDLDSRFASSKYDARGQIMSVTPGIPSNERSHYLEFWAEHFSILRVGAARIVVLNSAAYHGYGKDQSTEYGHGRVTARTIEKIKAALEQSVDAGISFNILVCHHHLVRNNDILEDDYSEMLGADQLLSMIGSGHFGTWLVIHGHKHRPKMFYAPGGGSAPVILSAASLSYNASRDSTNKCPNQFHLVTLNRSVAKQLHQGLAGEVRSWDWDYGRGWSPPASAKGLPVRTGFGYRGDAASLATLINDYLEANDFKTLDWRQLVQKFPGADHLLPHDMQAFRHTLKASYALNILEREGLPDHIGREFSGRDNAYKSIS